MAGEQGVRFHPVRMVLAAAGIGFAAAAAAVLSVNVLVVSVSARHIPTAGTPEPTAYVAIVPGAQVLSSGKLSAMLEDRVRTAVELYHAGRVRKLLLTGDHRERTYNEVGTMRRHALGLGVRPRDIFVDHQGLNTYRSMQRARRMFLINDCVIVSQGFHLPRAVYIARALGMDATGYIADRRRYGDRSRRSLFVREVFARVKAFFEVHIRPPVPCDGPITPITGDGRLTWERPPERCTTM